MMERIWTEIRSLFLAELREKESDASPAQGDEGTAAAPPSGVANHGQPGATPQKVASASGGNLPVYAANAQIARILITKAAELGRQPDFRAYSNHLGLAYMAHHILQCALREEIALPSGIDCDAAHRFVDAVFEAASRLFREPSVKGLLL